MSVDRDTVTYKDDQWVMMTKMIGQVSLGRKNEYFLDPYSRVEPDILIPSCPIYANRLRMLCLQPC